MIRLIISHSVDHFHLIVNDVVYILPLGQLVQQAHGIAEIPGCIALMVCSVLVLVVDYGPDGVHNIFRSDLGIFVIAGQDLIDTFNDRLKIRILFRAFFEPVERKGRITVDLQLAVIVEHGFAGCLYGAGLFSETDEIALQELIHVFRIGHHDLEVLILQELLGLFLQSFFIERVFGLLAAQLVGCCHFSGLRDL